MASNPPAPPPKRRRGLRRVVALVVVLAIVVGLFLFFTVGALAGAPSPANLIVFSSDVTVKHGSQAAAPGKTGDVLTVGDVIATTSSGQGGIKFPDGSLTRLAPSTSLTITSAQLASSGNLAKVSLTQTIGRTFSTVQHLVGGATYTVAGHSATAEVRGTDFEVNLNADGSVTLKLYDGGIHVTGGSGPALDLTAGQQTIINQQGGVGGATAIQPDPNDPFNLQIQNKSSVSSTSINPGTTQSSSSQTNVQAGQTVQGPAYASPGGTVSAVLSYPGSLMRLTLTGPNGQSVSAATPPPVKVSIPNGPPGTYVASVTGLDLPAGGEPYFLTVGTDAPCTASSVDENGVVRKALSGTDLASNLVVPGLTNVHLNVIGSSFSGAIVSGTGTFAGAAVSGTAVVFAAPPNLGAVVTSLTVSGAGLSPAQANQFASAAIGHSLGSIPVGFSVDRLYSCNGIVVVEGRH